MHERVIAHRISSFWISRVSTREEGRSPRLPATYDKKVQWVEENFLWLNLWDNFAVLAVLIEPSSKNLATGCGLVPMTWLNQGRIPSEK